MSEILHDGLFGNADGDRGRQAEQQFEALRLKLRQVAARLMGGERPSHSLGPTDLLHEWYVCLGHRESLDAMSEPQIVARAADKMFKILVDHARRRGAQKRGGNHRRVALDDIMDRCERQGIDAVGLNDALEELKIAHPRPALVITLRFLSGFTQAEVAAQLGCSVATVAKAEQLARAWLKRRLGGRDHLES